MNPNAAPIASAVCASLAGAVLVGAMTATAAPLALEISPGADKLMVGPVLDSGVLLLYRAADLAALKEDPQILLKTNTPFPLGLSLALTPPAGRTNGAWFFAARLLPEPAIVEIPAGAFVMGSPASEPERAAWEGPQTMVTLDYSFKMGKYEVTQGEWQAAMSNNPSYFTGDLKLPVEQVSWEDATNYCWRLTQRDRQYGCLPAGWAYRLPTEAEWEYACRAGGTNAFGDGTTLLSGMANFDGRYGYDSKIGTIFATNGISKGRTVPVGGFAPNAWGLYDMAGNTWEWCLDAWSYNLPGGSVTNPLNSAASVQRVIRGGGWYNEARECRAAYRLPCTADFVTHELGFRVVLAPEGVLR